ncbi:MAG: hypothetical protein KJO01_07160 [Gammaproteobacteria bacterium]|nr:hypothetical protein [Gammaproteobacteria bacterium]MBT8110825.1 hypothetical protein [Gammaproteobacteria bacterium]NNL45524.1 hypothetical protein [Woeseiaceae bacterium]
MWKRPVHIALTALLAVMLAAPASAQTREQAKRIYDRLAGVPPTLAVLDALENNAGTDPVCVLNGVSGPACAAYIAMESSSFYNVTLKNFAAPWTNREGSVFVPLNDYIATVIGMIRDDIDFRTVLSADLQYVGRDGTVSSAPAANNNNHYGQLEAGNHDLKTVLEPRAQSGINNIPASATAGVITSRAASEAFFIAGTNRAMFRFTMVNHFCTDMEQLHDPRMPPDRIRQDVSRSPGGDSRLFLNNCVGCHTGMDPMAQAFAYYNYNDGTGALEYSGNGPGLGGTVQAKYFNNDLNFPQGFRTPDDHWTNYWRNGQNRYLGFNGPGTGDDFGAKSLGVELSNSDAFAACQVKKVFKAVCLRDPETDDDHIEVGQIVTNFENSGFKMKRVFADTAEYCMGQ